jgi:hypothetical protein
MATQVEEVRRRVAQQSQLVSRLRRAMGEVLVGQTYMIDRMLVGLRRNQPRTRQGAKRATGGDAGAPGDDRG